MTPSPPHRLARCLVATLLALGAAIALPHPAAAVAATTPRAGCPVGGVEVDLAGSDDTAVVSGHARSACRSAAGPGRVGAGAGRAGAVSQPFLTYEIACSTDTPLVERGLCASTPCSRALFFAFRTLHRPDGRAEPAGYSCVWPDRAPVGRALAAAEVFAAIRRVKLPGGAIQVTPSGRGLANVPSRMWLAGDAEPPVNLRLAGSTVHAEFQPVGHRWTVGPGRMAVALGPGGAVVTFPRRGDFVVTVVTTWSASAFLDGRFVGQVAGLASTARITYPVAELRTALSG
jgi:hypothetical protein